MYCTNCGYEIKNETKFCPNCGQAIMSDHNSSTYHNNNQSQTYSTPAGNANFIPSDSPYQATINPHTLLTQLSEKLKINGIIWIVIASLQILGGLFINWVLLIIGVLNIVSAIKDINYSKTILTTPDNIVARFEPLIGPIITLVYNLVIGGIIGVIGSIYYFVAIRGFVLQNRAAFEQVSNT